MLFRSKDAAEKAEAKYQSMMEKVTLWVTKLKEVRQDLESTAKNEQEQAIAILKSQQPAPKDKKIPKVNTKIATIKRLTKRKAMKGKGVLEWLDNFRIQIELYVRSDADKVAYLMSEAYVEPAVWEGILDLYETGQEYTFAKLVTLLDQAYPDTTPQHKRIQEFAAVKQVQPHVEVYNMKKQKAWARAYGGVDHTTRSDYLSYWIEGLHPLIKRKIKDKVEGGNVKGKQYTLAELEEIAFVLQAINKDKPKYLNAFPRNDGQSQSNTNAASGNTQDQGNVNTSQGRGESRGRGRGRGPCHFYNTRNGCRRGNNCPFEHQPNANAANAGRRAGRGDGGNQAQFPGRGNGVPNSVCVNCFNNDPNYDDHYWVDCPKATCQACHQVGHTRHKCPTVTCAECQQTGHTKFYHPLTVNN